jgi:hypothetical protein
MGRRLSYCESHCTSQLQQLIICSISLVPTDNALPSPHHWDQWRISDIPAIERLHFLDHPHRFEQAGSAREGRRCFWRSPERATHYFRFGQSAQMEVSGRIVAVPRHYSSRQFSRARVLS